MIIGETYPFLKVLQPVATTSSPLRVLKLVKGKDEGCLCIASWRWANLGCRWGWWRSECGWEQRQNGVRTYLKTKRATNGGRERDSACGLRSV